MSYYIAPDSDLYVCKGVPLDPNYQNTIYWASTSAGSSAGMTLQSDYFDTKIKYKYDKLSYQRVDKGKIRVEQCADDLYDCNYMKFRNTAFGNKWWYAFITGVEYINNVTSEISYEIDVMQTWFFSYDLGYCFVEREHVDDDSIGANVIDEGLDTGNIKCVSNTDTGLFGSYKMVLATGYAQDGSHIAGGNYTGLPSGLDYIVFDDSSSGLSEMLEYLNDAIENEKDDAIACIWMQPANFCDLDTSTPITHHLTMTMLSTIDGYEPRNNKLFTYPYNYMCVDCGNDTATYRYEWFKPGEVETSGGYPFVIDGIMSPNPQIMLAPEGYNNWSGSETSTSGKINYTESLIMKDFPQIAWSVDAYTAWVASGGYVNTALSVAGSVGQVATGIALTATGAGAILGVSSIIGGVIGAGSSVVNAVYDANKGATNHGMQGSNVNVANHSKDFYFKVMQVQADYARTIDNYFTMFGYKVNRVKQPNRTSREKWNYVKTVGCIILPESIPADDVAKIEQIYDNGITFWHSPSYVGRYDAQNPIV